MDKDQAIKMKNQILFYLNEQLLSVTHKRIYEDLNLSSYPLSIVNPLMDDLVHRGYIVINGISGARTIYKITNEGREFVAQGGFRGQLLLENKLDIVSSETQEKEVAKEKKKLFISYASDNLDKVKLIKKGLVNHPLFEPYIVADRRRPNNALAKLVKEGIESSYCIIPLLSPQSFKEQWINQEIGYAEGVRIPIKPIVEESLLAGDYLKGFVNKQHQCPYTYKARQGLPVRDENKGFMHSFRLLIKDLEEEIAAEKNKDKEAIAKANQSFNGRPVTRAIG